MPKNNVKKDPAERAERGSQGRFADTADDRVTQGRNRNEGASQGGNGLSQKRDRMEEVSRKGGH